MQSKEKTRKRVKRPGFTDKRFFMRDEHKNAIAQYQKRIEVRTGENITWEQALEIAIETHPVIKKLITLSN